MIWRTRSLDEANSSMEQSDDGTTDEIVPRGGARAASALHSSFDAGLLHDGSPVCGSLFGYDDGSDSRTPSWDEGDPSYGDRSSRKHQLPQAVAGFSEAVVPGTVRKKLAKRAANSLNAKTPGRPRLLPPGSVVKNKGSCTPTSAVKRRMAPLPQRKSPMRRVPPPAPSLHLSAAAATPSRAQANEASLGTCAQGGNSFLRSPEALTPTRSGGPLSSSVRSLSKWHNTGTTTASTLLETTTESDSADTSSPSSPTTTRFRFTAFPASLPRVNNPRNRQCPDSVRKHMSFADGSAPIESNLSRDDDGTHNTSISSLSGEGGHLLAPAGPEEPPSILELKSKPSTESDDIAEAPIHASLFLEDDDDDNFGYSDDESADSPVRGIVGRTRLNFNMALSPHDNDANRDGKPQCELG